MNDDRSVALEQIVAELELLSLEEQIWLVERLTDRILVQMDQPKMAIGAGLHNDLEKVVLPHYPKVQNLRNEFAKTDSLGVMMSGSGSTVFALAQSLEQAEAIEAAMRSAIPDSDLEFWITKFCHSGVQLVDSITV